MIKTPEQLAASLPPIMDGTRLHVAAIDQRTASAFRAVISAQRGKEYADKVVCRDVNGIHEWGMGLYSDDIIIHDSVWAAFSELPLDDQNFVMMLTTEVTLGEFFQVKKDISEEKKVEKEGLWTRIRKKIASWIMPS